MIKFASKTAFKGDFTGNGDVFLIENGNPVQIYAWQINVSSNTKGVRLVLETPSNSTLIPISMDRFTEFSKQNRVTFSNIPFLADRGLQIRLTDDAGVADDISVSVFYSHVGS